MNNIGYVQVVKMTDEEKIAMYYEDGETKPGIDCAHLCHDCKDGAYCWDSECNENKNS